MKKIFLSMVLAAISVCGNAQFQLTPSSGLMTEDGPYIIQHTGTEAENYQAAVRAVQQAIPDANIGELEYEKSFMVTYTKKGHEVLPGAFIAHDWSIENKLKIEASEDKISVSFAETGDFVVRYKGEVISIIYPRMGKTSFQELLAQICYLFNSKGKLAKNVKGASKLVEKYEQMANEIAKAIESKL